MDIRALRDHGGDMLTVIADAPVPASAAARLGVPNAITDARPGLLHSLVSVALTT
jgi:hypothetical protein